jgi:hypothetical protein
VEKKNSRSETLARGASGDVQEGVRDLIFVWHSHVFTLLLKKRKREASDRDRKFQHSNQSKERKNSRTEGKEEG